MKSSIRSVLSLGSGNNILGDFSHALVVLHALTDKYLNIIKAFSCSGDSADGFVYRDINKCVVLFLTTSSTQLTPAFRLGLVFLCKQLSMVPRESLVNI